MESKKFARFASQFSFLKNEQLVPEHDWVEVVRVSRISRELLALRPRYEGESGYFDCLDENRVWLLGEDGNVLTEVRKDGVDIHDFEAPCVYVGETVGDAVQRIGAKKVHYALRRERGHVNEVGSGYSDWYTVTVYRPANFSLTEWAAEQAARRA